MSDRAMRFGDVPERGIFYSPASDKENGCRVLWQRFDNDYADSVAGVQGMRKGFGWDEAVVYITAPAQPKEG